jgi:hypothetical protein
MGRKEGEALKKLAEVAAGRLHCREVAKTALTACSVGCPRALQILNGICKVHFLIGYVLLKYGL